ncbi:MAG TPA: GNAT family N-acetyltransferase [Bacilli bacterium]|nr:GNAT family N-acetyltransferase [Bacilli bacterium]
MRIKYFDTVKQFLNEFNEILLEKEEVNQLILFNANNMLVQEQVEGSFYGGVWNEEGVLKFIFLHMPPYNLLISSIGEVDNRVTESFAMDIASNHPLIRGINARKEVAYVFSNAFVTIRRCNIETHFTLDIMKLTKTNDCNLPNGIFRKATDQDIPLIVEWNQAFFAYIGETIEVLEDYIKKIKTRVNEGKYYLFETPDNIVVSMAAASRYLTYGVAIGPVFTPEIYRNKGYGMAVVHHLCQALLQDGHRYVTLYVDQKNPVSNHVYLKIGFEIVEDQLDIRFVE